MKCVNNVCRALVMGVSLNEKNSLRCKKYRHIDIEVLREVVLDNGRLN